MNEVSDEQRKNTGSGRMISIIALVVVLGIGGAWAAGLFNVDTSGKLETPKVTVKGGEMPNVQVETADIDVGTKTETIEVPTVSVTKPDDDGSTRR